MSWNSKPTDTDPCYMTISNLPQVSHIDLSNLPQVSHVDLSNLPQVSHTDTVDSGHLTKGHSYMSWNSKPTDIDPCYMTISNLPQVRESFISCEPHWWCDG